VIRGGTGSLSSRSNTNHATTGPSAARAAALARAAQEATTRVSRAGARADQRDRTGHPQIEPVLQPRPTHEPAGDGGGHNFGAKKPPGPLSAASTGAPVTPTSAGARCRRVEKGGTRTARSATAERVLVHAVNHPRPAGPNPIAGGEQELSGAPTRCSGHTDPRAAVASSEQRGRLVGRKTVLPGRARALSCSTAATRAGASSRRSGRISTWSPDRSRNRCSRIT